MRILIADDHAALRRGLIEILAEEIEDAEFGEASEGSEALALLGKGRWDVLVLDVFMPGRGGLELLHFVRKEYSKLPVLVLSSAPEEQMALRVLKSGADGYLSKQAAPEELVNAVRKVLSGGRYISPSMAERLADEFAHKNRSPAASLSNREFSVICLLAEGLSIKEIAHELSLSAKTVSTYHARIREKLGVRNDIEMIRCAIERGLLVKSPS